ncbi:TIGR03790 family protein [Cephaloticoccus primus]|uniref:TIGR03790 family protein n=1 Tax=Cephaloticoccus primus TaxID=1548207 RepID=UPI0018D2AD67|nr:TIGR03790 family protein [Cephaloticoccus primus]
MLSRILVALFLLGAFGGGAAPASLAFSEDAQAAARLVILANADDADSLRIARHYAAARGVPEANIVALPLPREETISWERFVEKLWEPLQDELIKRGWIDALKGSRRDPAGRRRAASSGHTISYLVVCRGVPLRIEHAEAFFVPSPDIDRRPEFRSNAAAVDSELSLLAYGDYNINAYFPNPLFRGERVGGLELGGRGRSARAVLSEPCVIKVARLDGPSTRAVLALIDRTLEAEERGLRGRAYVDVRGPHAEGEVWMEQIAERAQVLGFETQVNREEGNFSADVRFAEPVLYFGWYAADVEGPFTRRGFRFEPGAIAVHVHSYSAATLRSDSKGWAGPLIARGAVATVGAVYEPYLQLMHYPHVLFDGLARGERLADAAYAALPALSWQNVLIGDPLYRPFKHRPAVAAR